MGSIPVGTTGHPTTSLRTLPYRLARCPSLFMRARRGARS